MPQTTEKERSQAARETVTVAVASSMALFAGVVAMWVMTLSSMRDTYALQVSTLTQSVAKQLTAAPPASREQTLQALQADEPPTSEYRPAAHAAHVAGEAACSATDAVPALQLRQAAEGGVVP